MDITRTRIRLAIAVVAAGGISASWGSSAFAGQAGKDHHHGNHGNRLLLEAPLAPSTPSDAAIFGVTAGGATWSLHHGKVRLGQNGSLRLDVDGLVLTSTNANPLPDLAASVFCNGSLVGTSAPVSFSTAGDADIRTTISLPAACFVPAVLLHPATGSAPSSVLTKTYIAFDGSA